MLKTSSFEENLRAVVGPQNLRAASMGDVVSGVFPQFVAEPDDEHQLAAALSLANDAGIAVIPRGGATKLDWGNPPRKADLILSTARLNRIVEHAWADLTVTVEAGCTLQRLQETLAQHGQRLAFDTLWPEHATIGGVLSTNDSGTLRLRFGALRDLIIGVTIALPDGTLASSGGKVVKNVAGYDLPKLVTGALGTLGVITRAVFRLHPLPRSAKTFSFTAETFQAMQQHILAIQDSQLAHTSLQVRCAAGELPAADILFEATDVGLVAQESHLRDLLDSTQVEQSPESFWNARQNLWNLPINTALLAKISLLPTDIAKTLESLNSIGESRKVNWQIALQATGIGMLRLEADPILLSEAVEQLRRELQSRGGALVVLRRPPELHPFDTWGDVGDSVSLMREVKHQLDPKSTLNPGRFVGGI
ncbi:MAG TPA: FAD-binding oxidoreductase [Candidatus Sulfotelmatobacter sp.]|jgi:glycolate oxidase FAD binding subunit|nr:FAD-binding oxidoreductase [Candidatus Sulfotelmatobacter sp.]